MKFLWSMRNRKKPCKTLVYGLLFGAFLTLQPKAWQKSLILLVAVMSRFLIIQVLIYHTRVSGVCTSSKISFGAWEYMSQSHLEQSLGRGFGIFSRIDARLWLHCRESFKCRNADQLRCQAEAALGAVCWPQGRQEGGHRAVCPQPGLLCSPAHGGRAGARAPWLAGDARSLVQEFWVWEAVLQKGFYVQLFGQIVFKWSHKVFVSLI